MSRLRATRALLLTAFFVCGAGRFTHAMDLYVAPNGNDSTARTANNIGNPWRTPAKAFQTAVAGDTVYFRAGTYTVTTQIDVQGNDGTASAPITFRNYPGEAVTIAGRVSGGRKGNTVIYLGKGYVVFQGLTLTAEGLGNEGAIVFVDGEDHPRADNVSFIDCTFNLISATSQDNTSCLRFQHAAARNGTVLRCIFRGNGNGVQIFRSPGIVVKNSDISVIGNGIYVKHSNASTPGNGMEFSYNYIHDCGRGGIRSVANYSRVVHNLFVNCNYQSGDAAGIGDGGNGGNYNTIDHNTVIGVSGEGGPINFKTDGGPGVFHNTVTNNITYSGYNGWHEFGSDSFVGDADIRSDYNLYNSTAVRQYGNSYSLAGWRTRNGRDSRSLSGTPTFVGGGGITGYALRSGSLGKGAASDGTDIGANVSQVGPGRTGPPVDDGSGARPPAPPSSVRIVW